MLKRKLWILVSLVTLLGVIAALALSVGRISPQALSSGDPDLLVPAVGKTNPNWKAQPVAGAPATLPWANLRVNSDAGSAAQNEPFVAVDPANAQHLVVGANNWAGGNGQFEVTAYVSFDGGRSWAASAPYVNRNASRLNAADPTVAFGPDGSLYFAFVAFGPADGAVAVSRSLDGGRSWASQSWATGFTTAADKPALAAGPSALYLLWQGSNALLSRTSPDGATWGTINTVAFGGHNAAPVVDRTGALNVFYTVGNSLLLGRSVDKGANYSTTTVSSVTPLQARPTAYRATIYPAAAASADGSLIVAWADGRNAGHGNDILASRSLDNGASWSTPLVVNSDAGNADQLMPAMTAGSDGAVTVAWLDTRNDPARVNYDVYMARTTPGAGLGFSFGANQRVTNVASNPNNDPQLQGSLIGDYFAIGAGAGLVYPVWTDTRNNNEDIYMAPVSVSSPPNN